VIPVLLFEEDGEIEFGDVPEEDFRIHEYQ